MNESIEIETLLQRIRNEISKPLDAAKNGVEAGLSARNRDSAQVAEPDRSRLLGASSMPPNLKIDLPILPSLSARTIADDQGILIDLLDSDGESFVLEAYRSMLKRPADAGGLKFYIDRLENHCSKLEILSLLRHSPEGQPLNANVEFLPSPGTFWWKPVARLIDRIFMRRPNSWCHVDDLLCYEGKRFIRMAYKEILLRPADSNGLEHQFRSLQYGASKVEILLRLRYSPEGKRAKVRVYGLTAEYWFFCACRVPLFGRLLRIIAAIWLLPNIRRKQQMLNARLIDLTEQASLSLRDMQAANSRALRDVENGYQKLASYAAPIEKLIELKDALESAQLNSRKSDLER